MSNFQITKKLLSIFCCFFDVTEIQEYNYIFWIKPIYGNKITYAFSLCVNISKYRIMHSTFTLFQ
jgi:hypothetical protein